MEREDPKKLVFVKCSKDSFRRFIKLYLSINKTPYWFHQTLTFKSRMTDEKAAHAYLKRLLDSLQKQFPQMACIFIREYQKSLGIHFHVIFLFFPPQSVGPESLRRSFGREVFRRWNKIHAGMLVQGGNMITLQEKDFSCISYLLKGVKLSKSTPREIHWQGVRNTRLIRTNSCTVSKGDLRQVLKQLLQGRISDEQTGDQSKGNQIYWDKRMLNNLRDYVEAGCVWEWENWKRVETGRKGKVSDQDCIDFLNSRPSK